MNSLKREFLEWFQYLKVQSKVREEIDKYMAYTPETSR
jgi:hypothetical protein